MPFLAAGVPLIGLVLIAFAERKKKAVLPMAAVQPQASQPV